MTQEINLLQKTSPARPALRPTSAPVLAAVIGAAAMLAALYGAYEQHRLGKVEAEAAAVERTLKESRTALEKVTAARAQRPDTAPDARLAELDAQLQGRLQVLEVLKSGAVGNTGGFAEYLLAFSRQAMEGVWLTGFDLNGGGTELAITGRALKPELVPTYLQRLTQESPLQGRRFASMVLAQPGGRVGQSGAAPEVDKAAPSAVEAPPYIEFEIASASAGPGAERSVPPVPVSTGQVIEPAPQPKKPEPAK